MDRDLLAQLLLSQQGGMGQQPKPQQQQDPIAMALALMRQQQPNPPMWAGAVDPNAGQPNQMVPGSTGNWAGGIPY